MSIDFRVKVTLVETWEGDEVTAEPVATFHLGNSSKWRIRQIMCPDLPRFADMPTVGRVELKQAEMVEYLKQYLDQCGNHLGGLRVLPHTARALETLVKLDPAEDKCHYVYCVEWT